jgi:signal transduction histidine kinase
MTLPGNKPRSVPDAFPLEELARRLRHEGGDFLQKVYATVAILQARFPPEWDLEREILGRLRRRAEAWKGLLDAVQDYLCPIALSLEPTDLAELLGKAVDKAQRNFPQARISLETPGPATALIDPDRMAQVAEALLENACEAGATTVTVRLLPPHGEEMGWTVLDDGSGMPSHETEKLFSPFFTTKVAHAGLGLAVARKIMAAHGGRIAAQNLPEKGFTTTATFPAQPESDEHSQPAYRSP